MLVTVPMVFVQAALSNLNSSTTFLEESPDPDLLYLVHHKASQCHWKLGNLSETLKALTSAGDWLDQVWPLTQFFCVLFVKYYSFAFRGNINHPLMRGG